MKKLTIIASTLFAALLATSVFAAGEAVGEGKPAPVKPATAAEKADAKAARKVEGTAAAKQAPAVEEKAASAPKATKAEKAAAKAKRKSEGKAAAKDKAKAEGAN